MSNGVKYQSRVLEYTPDGRTFTLTYFGSQADMESRQEEEVPAAELPRDNKWRLRSSRVSQESPEIWICEFQYTTGEDGNYVEPPSPAWGKKSATLSGSMLSLPLESAAEYRTCWNYYLCAAPGNTTPSWWEKATDCILSPADAKKFAWIKTVSEVPTVDGVRWVILKKPKFPGVESIDKAVYSVTETARHRSAKSAGRDVQNKLNNIAKPDNDFEIKDGDWKCDDAQVFWNGKYWLATLTWTNSPTGWNKEMYKEKQ